jgi:hypothetical protein
MLLPLLTIYNALAVPILLNGSEIFTFRKKDTKRFSSTELKFFTRTAGCTFLTTRGLKKFWGELKVEAVGEKLRRCNSNWLRHVIRMNSSRMRKIIKYYRVDERRRLGRTIKRQLDGVETGLSRPNS